eukprot:SAG31_NODE_3479_length_4224_cov_31.581091_2_plen_46_part_00
MGRLQWELEQLAKNKDGNAKEKAAVVQDLLALVGAGEWESDFYMM